METVTPQLPTVRKGPAAWVRAWIGPAIAAALFAAALVVLHRELQTIEYRDVREALHVLHGGRLAMAILFFIGNYLALTSYDQFAFFYIRKRIAWWRIAITAYVGCAVSYSLGFSLVSGTAVRHRFYSRWGIETSNLARVVMFNGITFWLGLLAFTGWSLAAYPEAYLPQGVAQSSGRLLGVLLMAMPAGYVLLSVLRRAPFRLFGFEIHTPSFPVALGQLLVSMADWALVAAALYMLLPAGGPPYRVVLGAFLFAQGVGLISNVPGGLGVFEGTVFLLLGPYLPAEQLVAALLLYRLMYNIFPLTVALLYLVGDELHNRRAQLAQFSKWLGSYSVQLGPRILAAFTFMAGLLLLLSGSIPAESAVTGGAGRLSSGIAVEISHVLAGVTGAGLLVLSQAVVRRVRKAYYFVLAALGVGIVTSLVTAVVWEAILLTAFLTAFAPSRAFFDRPVPLFDTRFSPGWVVAIAGATVFSLWFGLLPFRHVDYYGQLWWQLDLDRNFSRFLRAGAGAVLSLTVFSLWRMIRSEPPLCAIPTDAELDRAGGVIARQTETLPFLSYVRDKALLFNADSSAYLMYGLNGRSWIALGDPVGPVDAWPALIRTFVEHAEDYGGTPMFYEIKPDQHALYAGLGMNFAEIGAEARVPLSDFSLDNGANGTLKYALEQMTGSGVRFRVIGDEDGSERRSVSQILPQLRAVSDHWLTHTSIREKGFFQGFFDERYLSRFPVAVLEREGRIVAFANLLRSPVKEELAIDLMRFGADAPREAMDGLFAGLFLWGREQGYRWFNLGLVPYPPLWTRFARFIHRHGEAFANLESLRAYKEKFNPIWEPRYLAHRSGMALPVILADIAALAAGSYTGAKGRA